MDYTTVARVKLEMHASANTDDALLATLVTAASRAIDRKCCGVPDAVDYFKLEDITSEKLEGLVDYTGEQIICYPHKPIVNSVSSFTFQKNIVNTSYTVDASRIETSGPRVTAYPSTMPLDFPSKCLVTMNYNGGLGVTSGSLPDDLQEIATILTVRFYREAETGLADQIGVAEMSTMIYTKAWPIRCLEQIQPYIRRVGWRHTA